MKKVWRVAVIGAGDMGKHHVQGWQMAGQKVVSITDIDVDRANQLASEFQVGQVLKDYQVAIADPNVDIVSICLPLTFHSSVTIAAAERGKHVFCEKPLARNFDEVWRMEEAVRKAGVQFGIGFQRNLTRGIQFTKDVIQQGKIGRPVVCHCDSVAEIRPKRVMHDADGNAGPLMDLGCHYYIMWQTFFNARPKSVHATGDVMAKDRPELAHIAHLAIDTAVATVEYESGDVGIFTVTWGMPPRFQMKAHQDRIFGPKGGIEGGFNHNTRQLTLYEGDRVQTIELEPHPSLHAEQFSLFVKALDEGKQVPVSFQQGKDVLAVTLAIFRSIETGRVIDFTEFCHEVVH